MPDDWRVGRPTDVAATTDGTIIALLKRIRDLLGGTGSVRITDGVDTVDVIDLATYNALAVGIVDGTGAQITSFGGGTQYTEGDTDASITGTALLWEDAADTLRVASTAKALPVTLYSSAGVEQAPAGGTQYVEDAVSPADPTGNAIVVTRDDQLSAVTEVEGDWSRLRGTSKGALWVAIPDSSGDPITSFGGGTQYTEADTDASITGTALMYEIDTGTNTLGVVNSSNPLPISDNGTALLIQDGGGSITVDMPATAASPSKAEDVAHVTGDLGIPAWAVRDDTLNIRSDTEGDYEPLHTNANGALWVEDVTAFADDGTGFTIASSKTVPVGFLADEAATDSVNEGDTGIARMTLDRVIRVVAEHDATVRSGGTQRAVTRTAVAAASSGANTLVTNSNGGLTLRCYAMYLHSSAANNIYITADSAGTVVFGGSTNKIQLAANQGFILNYNPLGWFDTSANTDIVLNLSAAASVSGIILTAEV